MEHEGGLRRLAVRGAGVTVLSAAFALLIQIVATVVLARLLLPKDFGVVAMVTTVSLLLVNFGLNGFTEAIIQWEKIDRYLISNLFWIGIGAGLILTIGFAAAGSLLARFYHDPLVARVAVGISPTIFITSLSVQHLALLKRAMRFSALSINDIVARLVSVAVSIILAWAGMGYWALVGGGIALPLATSIGAWTLCRWIPSMPRRIGGTGSMVRFAIQVYGRFIVGYSKNNLDYLLIGWRFGTTPLGFYKKAYDLFALSAAQLVSPLTVVAVSALSRLNKDPAQYRRYFLRALSILAFIGMGVGANLTLVARDLVRILLGEGWSESGRILTYFGPGIGIMLLYYTHGWIHLSIGRADRWFRWSIVEFIVTAGLFFVGLRLGPVGIALGWVASFWILIVPGLWYAGRPIGLRIITMLGVVWKFLVASVFAGVVSVAIVWATPWLWYNHNLAESLERIVKLSGIFCILYLATVILLHRGLSPIYELMTLLRDMLGKGNTSTNSTNAAALPGIAAAEATSSAIVE